MGIFLEVILTLMVAIVACIEIGRHLRRHVRTDKTSSELTVIDGAIFGLLGLLLAFAFAGADSRFEARRQLIVQEANDIGTAYQRLDLLSEEAQPQLRQDMRDYTDARIRYFQALNIDQEATREASRQIERLQQKMWKEAVIAAKATASPGVLTLVLGSIGDMTSTATKRSAALQTHPPPTIYLLLLILALASALVAGHGMGDTVRRPFLHTIVYALALTITISVIVDLEYPRAGLIRVDRYDQMLIQQRSSMN
ncbi:bestrophin-like domain [Silvibacterium acidisoli]|uniref:bestrophin-like domain n=1 Tax=Acidobacteriaceae bacterium ZG23-2 TaxID=2883246 RepID=UPI00406CEE0E